MALSWELWRRGRMGAVLLAGFLMLALGIGGVAKYQANRAEAVLLPGVGLEPWEQQAILESASTWQQLANVGTVVLFCLSFLVVCASCTRVEPSPVRGFTGMPSRLFTLPVSSAQLALIPVVLGLVAVSLVWGIWRLWLFPRVFEIGPTWPSTYFWMFQLAWLATLQATVWGLPGYPRLRVAVLVVLVFSAVGGFVAGVTPGVSIDARSPWVLAGLGGWTALAASVAVAAVGMTRRGSWQGAGWSGRLWDAAGSIIPLRVYFDTPFGAQIWMEFRRTAGVALGILVLWSLLWFPVAQFWSTSGAFTFILEILMMECGVVLVPWSVLVGSLVALDPAKRTSRLSTLVASRPISSAEILTAKLVAMTSIWVVGLVWTGAVTALPLVSSGRFQWLVDSVTWPGVGGSVGAGLPVVLLLSFNFLIGLLPLLLGGRAPGQPWAFLMVFPFYFAIPSVLALLHELAMLPALILENLVPLALIAKVAIAAVAWAHGLRRRLIGWRFVATWIALWVAVSLVIAAWVSVSGVIRTGTVGGWTRGVLWVLLAFPVARIALSPLALAANRHR